LPERDELPLSLAQRLEQACQPFDAAWHIAGPSGPRPRIEDFLGMLPEPEHPPLLRELRLAKVSYRWQGDEDPQLVKRSFPSHPPLVDETNYLSRTCGVDKNTSARVVGCGAALGMD
jgi:hypothetical protein